MGSTHEVVITGIGVVCPIGIGVDELWTSVENGTSGVDVTRLHDASAMPSKIGAELRDFEPKQHVKPRKSLKVMCREIQTAFAASTMAATKACISDLQIDRHRIGSIFGSQMLYGEIPEFFDLYKGCYENRDVTGEFDASKFGETFSSTMNPLWMLKYLPNMPSCHIAIGLDAQGPNNSIVLGDASSLLAIIEAVNCIRRGTADIMIAGGSGSRLSTTPRVFRGDSNVATRWNDNPTAASRPFDMDRDGMVNGEGAGALVFERADHAKARGANVLCRVAGYGATCDVGDSIESRKTAIGISIRQALASESVSPDRICHVNAHGLSTMDNDQAEAQAIQGELGDVSVTAPKSLFGNLGPGSGTVELAASIMAMKNGIVPATINYSNADPMCPVNVVTQECVSTKPFVLALNQSGTGQAVSLLLCKP